MIEQEWDERYRERSRIWSGEPNQALVDEVADLPPGRVLDVGCGEGADAVWLAQHGWDVTALDVSSVALDRAREHARAAGVEIRPVHRGLVEAALPEGSFDLVSAQYPALPKTADHAPERALLAAVAPGGTLLVVHHVIATDHPHPDHAPADQTSSDHAQDDHTDRYPQDGQTRTGGFDPTAYVSPADVAAQLDDGWHLEVHEERNRRISGGAGAHHTRDVVVRARRLR